LIERASLLLDLIGLIAIATGISGGLWQWLGPWALCVGGAVVLAGSAFASRTPKPKADPQ